MKGILLAGGAGTRLAPLTQVVSKQLLPVYDKPMVYYPLSTLMLAGIREILIISTPRDLPAFRALLGDGRDLGLSLAYCEQPRPEGLAQAFLLARDFLAGQPACLILGDNLFYANDLQQILAPGLQLTRGALIFAYRVKNPSDYGVVEFNCDGTVLSLEEKPAAPRSSYAVPGIYFYDSSVVQIAETLRPSPRGELEITDLNRVYLCQGALRVERLGRGMAWLDTGSPDALLEAGCFIQAIEHRQGLKVACLPEIAFRMGFVTAGQLRAQAAAAKPEMGRYLENVLEEKSHVAGAGPNS